MDFIWRIVLLSATVLTTTSAQDIRLPPRITDGPDKIILYRDKVKVSLTCQGIGYPQPTYTWLKDGSPISQTAFIDFTEATVDNEGYYQCLATNPYGRAMTNVIFLKVATLGTFDANAPQYNVAVRPNDKLRVFCGPPDSIPTAQFSWSYNTTSPIQTDVVPSRRVQVDFDGNLCYASVASDEITGRLFRCNVENNVLSAAHSGAYSRILMSGVAVNNIAPALFFSSPSRVVTLQSQQTRLRAFFSGTDNNGQDLIQYSWTYNGGLLPSDWTFIYGEATSNENGTHLSAAGSYVCTGSNSLGSASTTIQLIVEAIPDFGPPENQPHDMNATDGDTVTMTCQPNAIPRADIQWFKNAVAFDQNSLPPKFRLSSDLTTLTISGVCKVCKDGSSDLMNIQCNASNIHGYSFAQGYVNVLLATTITSESTTVQWSPNGIYNFDCAATCDDSTPCTTEWTFEGQPIEIEDGKLTVDDQGTLQINTADDTDAGSSRIGTYTCTASNGYSNTTIIATIQSAELPKKDEPWWIAVLVLALVFLTLLIILLYCFCCGAGKIYCDNEGCSCCQEYDGTDEDIVVSSSQLSDQIVVTPAIATDDPTKDSIPKSSTSNPYVFLPTYTVSTPKQMSNVSFTSAVPVTDTIYVEGQGNFHYMVPTLQQQSTTANDYYTTGAHATKNNLYMVPLSGAQLTTQQTGQVYQQDYSDGVHFGRHMSQGDVFQGDVILREVFQGNASRGDVFQGEGFPGNVFQREVSQRGVIQGAVSNGGFNQVGALQGGAFQRGVIQGGVSHGGVNHGGAIQRGVIQGGVSHGGVNHGGAFQGRAFQRGVIQGGVSHSGVNQGEIIQGGVSQGRVSQGEAFQGRAYQEVYREGVFNASGQEAWFQYGDMPQSEV